MQTSIQEKSQEDPVFPRIYCWLQSRDKSGLIYVFQVESTRRSILNKVKKELKAEISGEGFNPSTGESIIILKKTFANTDDFRIFEKSIKYNIKRVKN